jgi:hypothetical protein
MRTLSSREVNQDLGRAKKATAVGPVIITDRGQPAHVLLDIQEYRRLCNVGDSVVEALACDDTVDLEAYLPGRSFPSRKVNFD